jgi:hypothetical protein
LFAVADKDGVPGKAKARLAERRRGFI